MKNFDIFLTIAQNIDHGYTHHLNEAVLTSTPQSIFWIKNKIIKYTPVNCNFTILNWGVRGSTLHRHDSMMPFFKQACFLSY